MHESRNVTPLSSDLADVLSPEAAIQPLLFCLYFGQSNVGNAGGDPTPGITGDDFPDHFLKLGPLRSWAQDYAEGEASLDPDRQQLFPYFNPGNRLFPLTCMGVAYEAGLRRTGKKSGGIIGHTVWWGAQNIDRFLKGTPQYQHALAAVASARCAAEGIGRHIQVAIFWCHGENMTPNYLSDLTQLYLDIREDVRIAAGSASPPHFIIQQINCGDANSLMSPSAQAQYFFMKQNNPGAYSCGPMYDCPLADNIHSSSLGRMVQGARHAHALDAIMRGLPPTGLRPASITRLDTKTVRVNWLLPPDATEISWSDWIPAVPQCGFEILTTDGMYLPLADIAITGATCLDLKLLSPPPEETLLLRAGMQITSNTVPDGWSNGRTTLEARTTYRTHWHDLGYQVPEFVAYPAMRFEETIPPSSLDDEHVENSTSLIS